MTGLLSQCAKLARTAVFHALRTSDRSKWERYEFSDQWKFRLQRIAEIIPSGSDVFEFGAGPVGLEPFLNPSCRLTSSDIVERKPGMMTIDLNRHPLPPDRNADANRSVLRRAGVCIRCPLTYSMDCQSL